LDVWTGPKIRKNPSHPCHPWLKEETLIMILALIEHDRGKLNPVSLEMLTLARTLGQPVEAVLVDEDGAALIEQVAAQGIGRIHHIRHEQLTDYAPDAWAAGLEQLIAATDPQAVLAPGSERGMEVLARVAARLGQPLAANCLEVEPDGDAYHVTRQRWGGSLLEEARLEGSPKLLTVAPHVLPVETAEPATPELIPFTPTLTETDLRVRVTRRETSASDKISLTDARVVIGGGRGVGSAEGFAVLEELAALVDGAVGGSRVVTNLGWRPHADQIGQTGTRIAPDLYIACGISGAIQHMVGCKGSKRILAINADREAPIMAKADYAVIGDLHEVLPAVIEEVKRKT
jgi:electron transfer flavoprotein alpha subunit